MDGKTVLVVDDEPHIRHMLDFKLSRAGFSVLTASHGQEAFELACAHGPDLVVTDYQMPGGDGLELCTRLRSTPQTAAIPALMLTARGYKLPQSDLEKTNIKALLSKPFSPNQLLGVIREQLGGSEAAGDAPSHEPGATAA
jgi:two-component system phosphate regulon response regulator PhoB